jgi:hypothetical protein
MLYIRSEVSFYETNTVVPGPNSLSLCSQCICGPYGLQHKNVINFTFIVSVMPSTTLFSDVVFSNPYKLPLVTNWGEGMLDESNIV